MDAVADFFACKGEVTRRCGRGGLHEARADGRKGGAVTRRLSCPDVSQPERNNKATRCCEGAAAITPGRSTAIFTVKTVFADLRVRSILAEYAVF